MECAMLIRQSSLQIVLLTKSERREIHTPQLSVIMRTTNFVRIGVLATALLESELVVVRLNPQFSRAKICIRAHRLGPDRMRIRIYL